MYKSSEDIRDLYEKAAGTRDLLVPAGIVAALGGTLYAGHRLGKHLDAEKKKWEKVDRAMSSLYRPKILITGPSSAKAAGKPTEQEARKRVPGLKVPRVGTPRLGTGTPAGKTPANPFRGNWVKLQGPLPHEDEGDYAERMLHESGDIVSRRHAGPGEGRDTRPLLFRLRWPAKKGQHRKAAGLPTEMAPRKKVSGLKVPRLATPRLGTGTPAGKTPANPYRGNWVKLKGPEKLGMARANVELGHVATRFVQRALPRAPEGHPAVLRAAHQAAGELDQAVRQLGGRKLYLGDGDLFHKVIVNDKHQGTLVFTEVAGAHHRADTWLEPHMALKASARTRKTPRPLTQALADAGVDKDERKAMLRAGMARFKDLSRRYGHK